MSKWNHVSAAILNGGAIRTSVDERSRNGENEEEEEEERGGKRRRRGLLERQEVEGVTVSLLYLQAPSPWRTCWLCCPSEEPSTWYSSAAPP